MHLSAGRYGAASKGDRRGVDRGEGGFEKYRRTKEGQQWESWSEERREIQEHHLTVSDGATVRRRARVTRAEQRTIWLKHGERGGRGSGPMCLSRFYKSIKRGISD